MDEEEPVTEYPAWRAAISELVKSKRLEPDTIFSFAELYDMFMVKQPQPETPFGEAQKLQLQFLAQFKEFESALLEEYQVALDNVRGIGYRIVPPKEQTEWAEKGGIKDVRKAIHKLANRLTNVDLVHLDHAARRANADALARLGMLSGTLKQVSEFRIFPPKLDDE